MIIPLSRTDDVNRLTQTHFTADCHSSFTGHCFTLQRRHFRRLHQPVRYASVYSLQPAGEGQSVPAGYQTDTGGLWDTGWTTGGTGTGSEIRGTISSYAETTERLHKSPPGD
jgi:hypothetical protein